ncbi:T9SS type A sorting domain-containing protein [Mangrovimonas sp. TPBH4]|uniref:T9SS type A sorting domain-containing protein n=1 Tax=Mangrovimonas sp. TPBH4 TaxID=1645914 RepID=UPI0006B6126F|nr:T9SS type A sorting domain-containing protein [Mangrovimonas sp. TPBH4]
MKKVTLLFMLLCSIITYSQISIVQNFDSGTGGWTSDWYQFSIADGFNAACSNAALQALGSAGGSTTATSPASTSNGTDVTVSFDYKISNFGPPYAPVANWGSFVFEYTTDGTTWTTLTTINDSNYTYSETCANYSTTIAGAEVPDGSSFQFRATLNTVTTSGTGPSVYLLGGIDNVSITQAATTVPNCDAVLTSPTTDVSVMSPTITWSNATGIPSGYKLAVGLIEGDYTVVASTNVGNVTSYQLPNLQFETTYYVLITPYNEFGDATGCTVASFTTEEEPLLGDVCSNPILIDIDSGDFSATAVSIAGFSDDYSSSPCTSNYNTGGKDMVYAIASFETTSISIDLTNIANKRTTVHVLDACVDVADYCIASATSEDSETSGVYPDLNLTDIVLYPDTIYYIVISSESTSDTNSVFDLDITTNDCIVPAATLTAVPDCDNYEFSVEVNVTHIGNANTVTISDGINADQTLDAPGIVTFDSYESGFVPTFTISNDLGCDITRSTTYYCTPLNDECSGALPLTLSEDDTCTNVTAGYTHSATLSTDNNCASNTIDVWYSYTPTETGYYNFAVQNTSGSVNISLYSGSCGAMALESDCDHTAELTELLTADTTYYIMIRSYQTTGQTFEICTTMAADGAVNAECSDAIVVEESDANGSNTISGILTNAYYSAELECGTSSTIDVWYSFTPETTGTYYVNFSQLNITFPNFAMYDTDDCSNTATAGLVEGLTTCNSKGLKAVELVAGNTYLMDAHHNDANGEYEFFIYPDESECSDATVVEESDMSGSNTITGSLANAKNSPELECGTTSSIDVWYSFTAQSTGTYNINFTQSSGTPSYKMYNTANCADTATAGIVTGLSEVCDNTGANAVELVAGSTYLMNVHGTETTDTYSFYIYPDASLSNADVNFEGFRYYPNPVKNTLTFESPNMISSVAIYNVVGQKVLATAGNNTMSTVNMGALPNGIYFAKVNIDGAEKTIKIIKE